MLAGDAVDWASLTSRASATMLPAALVPAPMHGFGRLVVGGGGFDELHPVHVPLLAVPLPPEEPALPEDPVPYGAPPEPPIPPLEEMVDVEEIMRFAALLARMSMAPPEPPPPPWPPW